MTTSADNRASRGKAVRKLAIIRSSSVVLSPDSYNLQEVGLAKALMADGISTDVYMAGCVGRPEVAIQFKTPSSCVRLILLPFVGLPGKQALFPRLFKLLNKESYDVIQVHEYSQVTSTLVAVYGKRRGIPVILCQGMYHNYQGGATRLLQAIYDITLLRFLRRNTALCIAKTTRAADYLKHKGFVNITRCPIGLDTDMFAAAPRLDVRTKYGLAKDDKILLYVGTLEKRRNPAFLIETYYKVLRARSDVALLIAGDGPEKEACEKMVERDGLQGKAIFLGRVSQTHLASLYAEASLFLLPTTYEIYGMVIMEAMYFGLPVIAASTAGADDIIENGIDGIVLDGLDSNAWVSSLLTMLSKREKRDTMSSQAREKIRRKYDWSQAVKSYADAYRKVGAAASGA